jgi:DHA2 family multidrug resistance protein
VFGLSALPDTISLPGSYMAVTTRYLGFVASIALVNLFQLYWRTDNLSRLAQELVSGNSLLTTCLQGYQQTLVGRGLPLQLATRLLETQSQLRCAMSYYAMIGVGLLVLVLALIILPPVHQKVLFFRQRPL